MLVHQRDGTALASLYHRMMGKLMLKCLCGRRDCSRGDCIDTTCTHCAASANHNSRRCPAREATNRAITAAVDATGERACYGCWVFKPRGTGNDGREFFGSKQTCCHERSVSPKRTNQHYGHAASADPLYDCRRGHHPVRFRFRALVRSALRSKRRSDGLPEYEQGSAVYAADVERLFRELGRRELMALTVAEYDRLVARHSRQ